MMCLGWYNKTTCNVRPQVDAETGQPVNSSNVGTMAAPPCPSSLWFWLAAGAILVGGAVKK